MTHVSNRAQSASTSPFLGLPTGAAIGINVAVLLAASVLAVAVSGSIPWYFLALFAASVVLTTTFVNIRGVYLTVASAPLLFVGAVLTISFLLSRGELAGDGASGRAARILVLYPLVQLFPVLFTVTLGAAIIGFARIWLIKRQNRAIRAHERVQRSRAAGQNRRNAAQAKRARENTPDRADRPREQTRRVQPEQPRQATAEQPREVTTRAKRPDPQREVREVRMGPRPAADETRTMPVQPRQTPQRANEQPQESRRQTRKVSVDELLQRERSGGGPRVHTETSPSEGAAQTRTTRSRRRRVSDERSM